MTNHECKLQHMPFFEALSRVEESSAEWRLTSAGLVTLRLFDAWVVEGPSVVAADAWGLRAVRETIDAIDVGHSARAILSSVVDAMESTVMVRVQLVAPRFLAYARALQFDGRLELAADVHQTIIAHAHPIDESDIVIGANMQLGSCFRALGKWQDASRAYERASCIAAMSGDLVNVLRARIAEANMLLDRGNLPRAQSMLDDAIAEASANRLADVKTVALHDRSVVAIHRGEYELAIKLAYEALEGYTAATSRDRVLGDIAVAFYELGMRDAARDAYLILAATAQEQYIRWTAMINLMECAAADTREPTFEQYRRELADVDLPVSLACQYHYYAGEAYRLFGRAKEAESELTKALELAEQHRYNAILLRAEQSLEALRDGGVVIIAEAPENPAPEVVRVAEAVREMRELAGVAG
jgi:tetratricopeptide (TPR) repeat protein